MMSGRCNMNLNKRISLNAKHLTKLEKDLLQGLLEGKSKFTYKKFTISNIAKEFLVSNTSVHRLSEKLGYDSFIQFKDDYLKKNENEIDESSVKDNDFVNLMIDTYSLVSESINDEIIDKMNSCKKINIYGMGMSNYLGKIFQIKLQLLGIPAEQHDDSRFMRLSSKILKKEDDLVIILSRSGETPELLEVLVEANLREIDVVLITETRGSTFERMCKYKIYTGCTQDSDADIDTRLNFHIAMDMLIKRFIEKYKKKV
ncbi:RpiR family transcriptional regulator [[Clostridium] sordellii]|uniref:Transcriptional regulator, RpiR family n=2 Tax=Paraclostridium sordellii TaxID=1505 RepID=A0ABP1XPE1_PARSO|nr:transcriptional regulator, RpiR family [[Clostridium] sordellii] [Paeniclostridium sordellii]CEN68326.1 RpiR family transcriptional regulator [[Clostridium] sordellii] [Paeniclostridium sordellii]CEN71593.1 RpiR family transcriptional regulator [[Clostridium] sordellii] [Paeniclostridium sordellii]CEO21836.1 RpiR family transcriptional regulator [[Clostridium] sordellii] [Paeniclostridium sordellii]CEP76814.1 RpiR family transcriptional regulator [[Clostridium] sordellii] [Paeniclostridium s